MAEPLVDAVIFDYSGVLRREGDAEYEEVAAAFGIPGRALWSAFHEVPEYDLSRRGLLDRAGYRAAVERELARRLGPERARACFDAWERARAADAPVVPEMDALLARLRGVVRLGCLTNAGPGARPVLERWGVAARFDDLVCSGDVGLAKPDPAVFRLAAARLGVDPSRCAFVDDQARHVEGARAAGMRAHRYEPGRTDALLAFLRGLGLPV